MKAGLKCAGLPVKESLIVPPTLALLVSIYQWCPGSLKTLPGQDQKRVFAYPPLISSTATSKTKRQAMGTLRRQQA